MVNQNDNGGVPQETIPVNENESIVEVHQESEVDALQIIEQRNALFQRVMSVAIAATSAHDWVDMGGKPYLQSSGAEKVARRFGVRIFDVVCDREDLDDESGRYYLYTVTGKAAMGERDIIEAIGTCSSRDKFFGRAQGKNKLIQDVDIANIKKKAYTNFTVNAITRILGLRNMTWDDLASMGINKGGKASVNYNNRPPQQQQQKPKQEQNSGPYWSSEYQGKNYIFAKPGSHFTKENLEVLGMKPGKKPGVFYCEHTEEIENALEAHVNAHNNIK